MEIYKSFEFLHNRHFLPIPAKSSILCFIFGGKRSMTICQPSTPHRTGKAALELGTWHMTTGQLWYDFTWEWRYISQVWKGFYQIWDVTAWLFRVKHEKKNRIKFPSSADPGFPTGGTPTPKREGAPTYHLANFPRKLHENEEIFGPGGSSRPLDSSMVGDSKLP